MHCHRPIILITSAFAAGTFGLLAAGCGGGAGSPGIASVASSTTVATTTTQSGSGPVTKPFSGPGGGPRGQFQIGMNVGTVAGAKFSSCMRKHGVTSFPDPNGQGVITIHSGMGIDPGSPAFRSARSVCDKLLPNGGQPTPAQIAQQQQQLLVFSSCMRAHGVKDFPDPSNGGLQIHTSPGSDLEPNNPTLQRAQRACQGHLPFKMRSETATSGGGG